MSVQGIYFLGLTVLLVLYYIVVISMDLFKHSKKGQSHEETFDVEDDEQKSVEETEDGFSVSTGGELPAGELGDQQQESEEVSDGIKEEEMSVDDDEEAIIVNEDDYTADTESYMGSPEDMDETVADIQQQMDENLSDGDPQYQEVMDSVSFEVAMDQPRNMGTGARILKSFQDE